MYTDRYDDEPAPMETKLTLGSRGHRLGVWVTSTTTDDRVFIPSKELSDTIIALDSLKTAAAALRNIGIGLSATPDLGAELRNSGSQELNSSGDFGDGLVRLVRLDEPSPFDCLLGGALGTADSFVDAHDSSPSVGDSPSGGSGCGCGASNPTEGEPETGATFNVEVADPDEVARAVDARQRRRDLLDGGL